MTNDLEQLDQATIGMLRGMARKGRSPSDMFRELKQLLGMEIQILTLISYFRHAFHLTLAEAKPISSLTRNEQRKVDDEHLFDELLSTVILNHRPVWENHKA
jgi:hypothetical protein